MSFFFLFLGEILLDSRDVSFRDCFSPFLPLKMGFFFSHPSPRLPPDKRAWDSLLYPAFQRPPPLVSFPSSTPPFSSPLRGPEAFHPLSECKSYVHSGSSPFQFRLPCPGPGNVPSFFLFLLSGVAFIFFPPLCLGAPRVEVERRRCCAVFRPYFCLFRT